MTARHKTSHTRAWWVVPIIVVVALIGSVYHSKTSTPEYQATCGMYVAVSANTTPSETYQASQLAQERVVSYSDLLKGYRVSHDTIAALGLQMTPAELQKGVTITTEPKSVYFSVSYTDPSPERAASIANTLCTQLSKTARDVDAPTDGGFPQTNVKIVDQAIPPTSPSSPSTLHNLLLALVVGLVLGLVLMFALDWFVRQRRDSAGTRSGHADVVDEPDDTDHASESHATGHHEKRDSPDDAPYAATPHLDGDDVQDSEHPVSSVEEESISPSIGEDLAAVDAERGESADATSGSRSR